MYWHISECWLHCVIILEAVVSAAGCCYAYTRQFVIWPTLIRFNKMQTKQNKQLSILMMEQFHSSSYFSLKNYHTDKTAMTQTEFHNHNEDVLWITEWDWISLTFI